MSDAVPGPSAIAKQEFVKVLQSGIAAVYKSSGISEEELASSISNSASAYGDLSSSIAFKLAKAAKKQPREVAQAIAAKLQKTRLLSKFSEANGYVNALYDEKEYSKLVIESVFDEKELYGSCNVGKDEKVLVEFPSVNPAHPWHIGHLRNAILGDVVSNLLEFCGYRAEREDYIDDLGLQVAQALWGYTNLKDEKKEKSTKFDLFLGEKYVEANKAAENPSVSEQIKLILKDMEHSGTDEAKKARGMAERCVASQYETAFAFGVFHDVLVWESDIVGAKLLDKALKLVKDKKAVEMPKEGKYADCVVLDLEKVRDVASELGSTSERYKVLVRSNGVANYAMKDFAFHLWKFGLLDADFMFSEFPVKQPNGKELYTSSKGGKPAEFGNAKKVVNIIDVRQGHEQATVKALLKLTGHEPEQRNLFHLAYGQVGIKEGTLSAREGAWLGKERNYTADDLLEEATKKALEIARNSKKISKENAEEVAREVAIAAIRFEFLRVAPEKAVIFDWDSALNFEANSGPYAMYMYARAQRVLEKGNYGMHGISEDDYKRISREAGFELVKLIGEAQEMFESACKDYRPNTVAVYLLELASLFSKFYEASPVLQGGESREARLAIVFATKQTIGNGLRLLGIKPLETM